MASRVYHASRAASCAVCGGRDGCSWTDEGLHLCRRRQGNQPGWRWLGVSKRDSQWHLYRLSDDPVEATAAGVAANVRATFFSSPSQPTDTWGTWHDAIVAYRKHLTNAREEALAEALHLPLHVLAFFPEIGYSPFQGAYTFPEFDEEGKPCGIFWRALDGRRGVLRGSRRGLYLANWWWERTGPIRIAEGATDTLALMTLALPVVGRATSMCGADMLGLLLAAEERDIRVVGHNDAKADGRWPGKEGAETVAARLRELLPGRSVEVVMPPAEFKDAREWVAHRLGNPLKPQSESPERLSQSSMFERAD